MWEPKLLGRLDSIKRHLMTGMATPYVIDEIECLQRDINEEMRATRMPRDYDPRKPKFQLSGKFVDIKDIRINGKPLDLDHDYFRGSSNDIELDLKIDETPLKFDSGDYPIHSEVKHWLCQLKIEPHATQGEKGPIGVNGYTPQKSNCPGYVEGPLQHFLLEPGTQGQKKPKDALGLGPF